MKFRLSRRPQVNLEQFDLKPICPSLHNDPAFSADPRSNPYFVTSHNPWSSPPLGHPVLKNNKKRHNALAPHTNLDSDVQLVQPPNFPNIPSSLSPQYPDPLTKNKLGPIPLSTTSMNQGPTSSVMSRRPSVLKKENKRMSLPLRRRSQPQLIKSFFLSMGKKAHRPNSDLPAAPSDTPLPSQPVPLTENLPTSASVASQKVLAHRGRVQDLDQIDQLDETNPWGIRIHHDGPYEAANVQANTRAGRVALGLASSNKLYNAHNYQMYIPPQVPTGVSLNLSPGQILSRNFFVPSIHPAHFPAGPLLIPLSELQYTATASDAPDSGSQVRDDPPPILESMRHGNNLSSIIGMAMLGLADNTPDLPDEQDLPPHDRVNQSEHCRVPSSFASTQPEPRGQSSQSFQNASFTDTSSNKLHVIRPTGHLRNDSNPPMYSEHIDDEVVGLQVLNETPSEKQLTLSFQTSQNPELLAGARPQQHYHDSDNGPPSNDSRNVSLLLPDRNIPPAPAVSRGQRAEITQEMQSTSLAQTSHPHRDGLHYRNEPDVQSTNYSASSYSSGQFQNGGRPPPLHRPKRLVMPSPLNTGPPPNAGASLHHGQVPRSQIFSSVNVEQTQFQSLRQPGSLQIAHIQHHGITRAEDVPILGGRKLRKKMSVIVTPTPGPVVTAVSFAPPIIGFQQNDGKGIAQSKTDKPKRFLSKRRSQN